ncbi:MAG: DUF1638 domain-containing protein [Bacillota bacterium]
MVGVRVAVIACDVLKDEVMYTASSFSGVWADVFWLEHMVHDRPSLLREKVQRYIDMLSAYDCTVLAAGRCSNGSLGVRAGSVPLVFPAVDDCVAILLGSRYAYEQEMQREPGTYYLTRSWIRSGDNPMRVYRRYRSKYGSDTALWVARELVKNYKRVVLIDTGAYPVGCCRRYAKAVARFMGARYEEKKSSLELLRRLFAVASGTEGAPDVCRLEPGEVISEVHFTGAEGPVGC